MFANIGWGEMAILVVAGLVILGPERLPGAVTWTMRSIRQAKDYATGATEGLRKEMGSDFDDLREPIAQLNELRQMTPRAIITKHVFDGDDRQIRDLEKSATSVVGDVKDALDPHKLVGGAAAPNIPPPARRAVAVRFDPDAT